MTRRSSYTRVHSNPIPKKARTLPIPGHPERGDGEDDGKYYRCWNCGFICNVDRDALGDDHSLSGLSYSVKEPEEYDTVLPGEDGTLFTTFVLSTGHIAPVSLADGTEATVRRVWYPSDAKGCPFCGTLNWRGDF